MRGLRARRIVSVAIRPDFQGVGNLAQPRGGSLKPPRQISASKEKVNNQVEGGWNGKRERNTSIGLKTNRERSYKRYKNGSPG